MACKHNLRHATHILILALLSTASPGLTQSNSTASPDVLSVFVAGDAIINQRWRHITDPDFLELIQYSREASVSVVNLETTLGNYEGFPQRHSGGTYLMAPPEIAHELVWAGVDMVGGANNHSFDYGSLGILATIESAAQAGLAIAGIGENLQRARQAAIIARQNRNVGLLSMTSSFRDYAAASPARRDLHGRPGLNGLEVERDNVLVRLLAYSQKYALDELSRLGVSIRGIGLHKLNAEDLSANLSAIRNAEQQTDLLILSIHAHQPDIWLDDFAHQAIDAGVDVFFSHGPHTAAGIEIYKNRPIFYGLGNFVLQRDQVERLPAEAFERIGLSAESTIQEYFQAVETRDGTQSFDRRKEVWQSVAAVVHFRGEELIAVELVPIDLGFQEPRDRRGFPMKAQPELSAQIIELLRRNSHRYGTRIEFQSENGIGAIELATPYD